LEGGFAFRFAFGNSHEFAVVIFKGYQFAFEHFPSVALGSPSPVVSVTLTVTTGISGSVGTACGTPAISGKHEGATPNKLVLVRIQVRQLRDILAVSHIRLVGWESIPSSSKSLAPSTPYGFGRLGSYVRPWAAQPIRRAGYSITLLEELGYKVEII